MNSRFVRRRDARKNAIAGFTVDYPQLLPISAKVSEIKQLWQDHQLIILGGATGSGKTTQLPKIALELGCGVNGRIGCTQPRRIAATAMARRLAAELKCDYGSGVGSQVRFEDRTRDETVLKFMTDGILLAEFRDDPLLRQYDTIIIDEAHERTLNIDFLLGLLKNILPRRKDLKAAISSATLDLERFSEFFPEAPVITIEGRSFPVEDIFLPPEIDEELPEQVARAVELLSEFDQRGNILVFLPGEREIRECTDMLNGRNYRHTEVLPLYARLSNADQQKVFQPSRMRRIILSTNVAETSLTIPDVRFCIDSGLARISRFNPRTRIQELQIEMISQASVRQRRGRCGRTSDGICVHLYSEDDFNRFAPYTDPEIKRSSLAGVILQMAALKLPEINRFPFIDPPKSQLIRDGIRTLNDLRAFDRNNQLTPDGRMLSRLPLDPSLGRMLLSSSHLKVVPQLLVICSGLTAGDVRERPAEKTQAADETHRRWRDDSSDFIALLNCWNDLAACQNSNSLLRRFCKQNYLNFRRVKEWRNLVTELADAIRYRQEISTVSTECSEQIHDAILSGIPRNIAMLDPETRQYRGTDGKKFLLFPGSGLAGKKRQLPPWIVCFNLFETSHVFGRTAAAIDPLSAERSAAHLCGRIYDSEHYEKSSGFVRAREKVVLGGLIINAGRRVDFGACNPQAAREIFIREGILQGEVSIPGTAMDEFRRIYDELHELELRMRRPGQLYDEKAAEQFFLNTIPPEINSVKALKNCLQNDPQRIKFDIADFMLEQFTAFDPDDYPGKLTFSGVNFKLSYRFAPGEADDGVTLLIKESMLNLLPDRILDYPIPGYFAEFGEALLRTLPKEFRRRFDGGISAAADRFAAYLKNDPTARQLPPDEALTEFLLCDSGMDVPPRNFDLNKIPAYLKMKIGLLNENGRLIKIVDSLPGSNLRNSKLTAAMPGAAKHISQPLDDWPNDGIIPEAVELPPGSGRSSYPALSCENDVVSKQLFLKLPEAKRHHRSGVLKLFKNNHVQQFKFLKRTLKLSNELKMTLIYGADNASFENSLLNAALLNAADSDLWQVRSQHAFEQLSRKLEMDWADAVAEICRRLENYSTQYTAIRNIAKRIPRGHGNRITEHLDLLFAPGFLNRPAVLTEYPRYLRALKIRADRMLNDPARDLQKGNVLEEYLDKFYAAWDSVGDITCSDGLYEFWLLLEECRIALFAPELKTNVKSAVSSLPEAWQQLRI